MPLDAAALDARPAPGVDAATRTDFGFLREALDALSDDQRITLELAYFEGLTATEISARLNVPAGTVKSRIFKAVRVLRTRLDPPGVEA